MHNLHSSIGTYILVPYCFRYMYRLMVELCTMRHTPHFSSLITYHLLGVLHLHCHFMFDLTSLYIKFEAFWKRHHDLPYDGVILHKTNRVTKTHSEHWIAFCLCLPFSLFKATYTWYICLTRRVLRISVEKTFPTRPDAIGRDGYVSSKKNSRDPYIRQGVRSRMRRWRPVKEFRLSMLLTNQRAGSHYWRKRNKLLLCKVAWPYYPNPKHT